MQHIAVYRLRAYSKFTHVTFARTNKRRKKHNNNNTTTTKILPLRKYAAIRKWLYRLCVACTNATFLCDILSFSPLFFFVIVVFVLFFNLSPSLSQSWLHNTIRNKWLAQTHTHGANNRIFEKYTNSRDNVCVCVYVRKKKKRKKEDVRDNEINTNEMR